MTLAWIGFSAEALLAYRSPYIKDLNRFGIVGKDTMSHSAVSIKG